MFRASICESQCALRQTIDSGEPVVNEVVYIINAAGQRVPISISTAILKDADGYPNHGNNREAWKAGCRFGYENPDYRS